MLTPEREFWLLGALALLEDQSLVVVAREMKEEIDRLRAERKEALAWLRERTTELEALREAGEGLARLCEAHVNDPSSPGWGEALAAWRKAAS